MKATLTSPPPSAVTSPVMSFVDEHRGPRVARLQKVLMASVPGSICITTGSIARGTEDRYSDIDLNWRVGESAGSVAEHLTQILSRVDPVESLRWDGAGTATRLAFIRFKGWPLFSRVDLEIDGNFKTTPAIGDPWTATESALMNVIGALKADLRGRPEFEGLIERGFHRVGAADPGGSATSRMQALVVAATRLNPALTRLAEEVTQAIRDSLADTDR